MLSEKWKRVKKEEVQDKADAEAIAFGHVVGDCAFVDMGAQIVGCTPKEVLETLMDADASIEKGYAYNRPYVERIAKRLIPLQQIAKRKHTT